MMTKNNENNKKMLCLLLPGDLKGSGIIIDAAIKINTKAIYKVNDADGDNNT